MNQILKYIVDNYINPKNECYYTFKKIKALLKEYDIRLQPLIPIESQIDEIIEELEKHIPIAPSNRKKGV